MLPHGIGKDVRVAVFAEGEKAREAEDAGADVVGSTDLATKIEEGFLDFDVAIATPDQMSVVGKLGRVLGPRGLMPNPKTGTVTMDVTKAVSDAKAGKLEYRTDRGGNVHLPIGKGASTSERSSRTTPHWWRRSSGRSPLPLKGRYIKQITVTTTMARRARRLDHHPRHHRRAGGSAVRPQQSIPAEDSRQPNGFGGVQVWPSRFPERNRARSNPPRRVSSFQEDMTC
jgi:ribosomal protein L1